MTTNAELVILSLVAEKSRHGYEIEQVIEERGMREWTEVGFSSIYYLLKKLEKEGLIEGQLEEAERGPARKVFHITQTGIKVRKAALLEALSVPWQSYPPLMLGLGNLPAIPLDEAVAADRRRDQAEGDQPPAEALSGEEEVLGRLASAREPGADQQDDGEVADHDAVVEGGAEDLLALIQTLPEKEDK